MSKKAELKLDRETYKVLKEFTVLTGAESEDEFIRQLIEQWVKSQYGIEEFENLTVKDLFVALNAIVRLFNMLTPVLQTMTYISREIVPTAPLPPPAEQEQPQEVREEKFEELSKKIEELSASLEDLKSALVVRQASEVEERLERPQQLDALEEMKAEMLTMFANAMRNYMRKMMSKMVSQQ